MNTADILQIIRLSLLTGLTATAFNLPTALAAGFLLTRKEFPGKSLVEGIINLPLVMPPVTTGYILLILLGKRGPLGSFFYSLTGQSLAFSTAAAVIASMIVSFPLVVRSVKVSMEMMDPRLEAAAHTLGAGRFQVFWRITIPLILPGIINGAVLGFARSLGEFGATITFAGNIQGVTRTIPLAVHSLLQIPGKEKEAALLVGISIFISFTALFSSTLINKRILKKRRSLQ